MKHRHVIFYIFLFLFYFSAGSSAEQNQDVLSIKQALSVAAENNPTMVAARKKAQIVESMYKNSKKFSNPELDIDVANIAHDLEDEAKYDERNLGGEIRINQPIQTWGKRGLTIKIARDELSQASYELEGLWLEISRQIKEQYNESLLQQKNIELTRDHLERAQRFYEQVNIQFNAGKARNHELARARLEVANARNAFLEAETNFYVSMGKLNILLGRNIQDDVRLEDNLKLVELKKEMDELMKVALKERTDILSQNQELAKREKQLKLAKRQRLPDVNLGLFVEREEEIYNAGAGISFELPFWNQFQGEIKEADLEKQIAEANLAALKREVELDVYMAYKNADLARRSVNNLQDAIKEANELLRIITVEYQEGEASFLIYLEGLASYRETKQHYLASLADYANKLALLEQSIGGNLDLKEEE